MKKILKQDIVIPAGTVFECCDGSTTLYQSDNYAATVGLTKDSCGDFVYGIDPSDPKLADWFEDASENAA